MAMKTPGELAQDWIEKYLGEDSTFEDEVVVESSFMAGYKAGHDAGVEATHKIYDAVREHLERQVFPVVQHEPLLAKHIKDK